MKMGYPMYLFYYLVTINFFSEVYVSVISLA